MLLVHTCCADCLLHLFEVLGNDEEIGIYFYNPNIHPQSEYIARLFALKEVVKTHKFKWIVPEWKPREYFEVMEKNHNKNIRCPKCWYLRLNSTFKYAKEKGYDTVTSTMLTSTYLDRETIIRMGQKLAEKNKLKFLVPEKIDCKLITRGFYKQNYCGCIFSLNERFGEKYNIFV